MAEIIRSPRWRPFIGPLLACLVIWGLVGPRPATAKKVPKPPRLNSDQLLFNSNRPDQPFSGIPGTGSDHNYEIYSMNSDGTNQVRLTNDAIYDSWWPKPSPDRRRIMFVRSPKGTHDGDPAKNSIWMMNADGSDLMEILPAESDRPGSHGWTTKAHPEWSPLGDRIALYAGPSTPEPDIYLVNPDGSNPVRVTNDRAGGPRGGPNTDPSWSPDGQWILFNGCPFGEKFCPLVHLEIHIVRADGTEESRLTFNDLADYDPYFSPDASTIAWLQMTGAGIRWGINRMAPDGSGITTVIDDGGINSKPAWSNNGSWIYFHRTPDPIPGYVFNVWKIRPDGTELTEIILPRPAFFSNNMSEYPVHGLH